MYGRKEIEKGKDNNDAIQEKRVIRMNCACKKCAPAMYVRAYGNTHDNERATNETTGRLDGRRADRYSSIAESSTRLIKVDLDTDDIRGGHGSVTEVACKGGSWISQPCLYMPLYAGRYNFPMFIESASPEFRVSVLE